MRKFLSFFLIQFFLITFLASNNSIQAQIQGGDFSGSDIANYQCIVEGGGVKDYAQTLLEANAAAGRQLYDVNNPPRTSTGKFRCPDGSEAILKPPTIQQIEIWFVRILYVVWAIVASLSFFYLVLLGYRYMISQGDVTKITEIRQKIIYYIVGFILVFLAVPILTTVFRLLGVNTDVQCYNVNMPGFQFFFTDLCTGNDKNLDVACQNGEQIEGLACQQAGSGYVCSVTGAVYTCSTGSAGSTRFIWVRIR